MNKIKNSKIWNKYIVIQIMLLFVSYTSVAQITLLGDNSPHKNVNDGNFELVNAQSWRWEKQSPLWTPSNTVRKSDSLMALSKGRYFSSYGRAHIDSRVLNNIKEYPKPIEGNILNWSFGADSEYNCKAKITVSLIFGNKERILAEKKKIIGGDLKIQKFEGTYTITSDDVKEGMPKVRVTLYSFEEVRVYVNYVNISVIAPETNGPEVLNAQVVSKGIKLKWSDSKSSNSNSYNVYRGKIIGAKFKKIASNIKSFNYIDDGLINGIEYHYLVTRVKDKESSRSPIATITKIDDIAPAPPTNVQAEIYDTEIKISWKKSIDKDVKYYSVFRTDAKGNDLREIAYNLHKNSYMDFTPVKDIENTYVVYAYDYSGNKSNASTPIKARVKAVSGTSFSDLILPMPIHKKLRADVWGADGVLPRDSDNGIEHPDWSYWGGRPVKDKDGLYHMHVTRWPANATKGHWEWPYSTVTHVVSKKPTGPYKVTDKFSYSFHDGLGHNPDIILLNDGTYMLYALIDWKATLFTSNTMKGPWKRLGTIEDVDYTGSGQDPKYDFVFFRNLSGVHLDDGRFMFVAKSGAIMISQGKNPLGPYKVLTKAIKGNPIIPEQYRNSGYEDPVLWKDDIQFHMMINAFWDFRAIYLRSPDGIHWKFNSGTAYTPDNTSYEDGTRTHWYKLERPHVIQDEYGRATHLSLAVIDVPKADDYAKDKHNSKNIIMPLIVHKRLELLNKELLTKDTKTIQVLIHSEEGFNAQKDIDLESLRYGASEEVNFGRGCKLKETKKKGKDLVLEFDGNGNGFTETNFAGKLLGKTKTGDLLIGFSKLNK